VTGTITKLARRRIGISLYSRVLAISHSPPLTVGTKLSSKDRNICLFFDNWTAKNIMLSKIKNIVIFLQKQILLLFQGNYNEYSLEKNQVVKKLV
jgi:hypothetical protein